MKFANVLARFSEVSEESDGGYLALCGAHPDSTPSLRIWRGEDNKVRVTCRAGCSPDEVIKAAGLSWPDMFAVTGASLVVPAERPTLVTGGALEMLRSYVLSAADALANPHIPAAETARAYALRRFGIDAATASELSLGVDDAEHDGYGFPYLSRSYKSYGRLTVPLCGFDGAPHGLQGRDLSGKCPGRWISLRNPEGHHWGAYGVFRGQGGYAPVLITEGPGDGLTAVAVGYDAVAIRGASLAASPEMVAELARGLAGRQVIICGDADTAGSGFNQRLADGLAAHGVDVLTLTVPYEGADLTDWRERVGPQRFPEALHAAVKGATPYVKREALATVDESTGALVPDADEATRAAQVMEELAERYDAGDVLNAHALVAFMGGHIKYADGLGFMVWNGRTWERGSTRVRQAVHYMGAALKQAGFEGAKGFAISRNIDDLMRELSAVPSVHVEIDAFDARPDLLSFRNGTVDLRTGELRPHAKGDMLTYALDLDYRPDATCPRWESFLREIFPGHPELADYMQRLCGYGATGHVSEQCFAVLWGTGANGKSVLTDTLTTVFRPITRTTQFATFEEKPSGGIPNDIAALRGSRFVMASEGESGKPMSESVLKRATGKDMMTARFMRKEFFEFKPSFLIMLATNHKPRFRGQDEGLWRRVKMIPFTRWFAPHERDAKLDAKLATEAEGIAAWAVRGAVDWYANGLGDPDVIVASVQEYRETSDALAGFYPGVLVAEPGAVLNGTEAFNAYLDWCEEENLPSKERWSRRAFYSAMGERKITSKPTNKGVALVGVRLAANGQQSAGPGIFAED